MNKWGTMLGDCLGRKEGPRSYEVPLDSQKEPRSVASKTLHAELMPLVEVLCCVPHHGVCAQPWRKGKVMVR